MGTDVIASAAALKDLTRTARAAMKSLIEARSLSHREDDPQYPYLLAELSWRIADAWSAERNKRAKRGAR